MRIFSIPVYLVPAPLDGGSGARRALAARWASTPVDDASRSSPASWPRPLVAIPLAMVIVVSTVPSGCSTRRWSRPRASPRSRWRRCSSCGSASACAEGRGGFPHRVLPDRHRHHRRPAQHRSCNAAARALHGRPAAPDLPQVLRCRTRCRSIFGGLKVASTLAVVGALTGEFVGSDKGLGYVLLQASGNLNTALLFATLVMLSVVAMVVLLCGRGRGALAIPWHVSQRASAGLINLWRRTHCLSQRRSILVARGRRVMGLRGGPDAGPGEGDAAPRLGQQRLPRHLVLRDRQGHLQDRRHRSRGPGGPRLRDHHADGRQRLGDVRHRRHRRRHGSGFPGRAGQDRLGVPAPEPDRGDLSEEGELEVSMPTCRGPESATRRAAREYCSAPCSRRPASRERYSSSTWSRLRSRRRCSKAASTAIESFDFLQVPLLEANGMPSASLPIALSRASTSRACR